MDDKEKSRSWFCVWNNPQETLTESAEDPATMAEQALEMWIGDSNTRTGAVAYCISAEGLIHFHMVLEDSNMSRFSAIKKIYPKSHIEPTKGRREHAEDYIQKKGKYAEKGEEVVYIARFGEIKGRQGQRKDYEAIEDLLEGGLTPSQIMSKSFSYRRYEKMIKSAFFARRKEETPFVREVEVVWHVGPSGSGKTYTAQNLMDRYGRNEVYIVTDYESGGFDNYCAERILFLEEFRGQYRYSFFLNLLDKYMYEFHSRYSNIVGLWTQVHITSILSPESIYQKMVRDSQLDPVEQLKRRITKIVYHWKQGEEYKTYEMPMAEYRSLDDLRRKATGEEFLSVSKEEMEQLGLDWGDTDAHTGSL